MTMIGFKLDDQGNIERRVASRAKYSSPLIIADCCGPHKGENLPSRAGERTGLLVGTVEIGADRTRRYADELHRILTTRLGDHMLVHRAAPFLRSSIFP